MDTQIRTRGAAWAQVVKEAREMGRAIGYDGSQQKANLSTDKIVGRVVDGSVRTDSEGRMHALVRFPKDAEAFLTHRGTIEGPTFHSCAPPSQNIPKHGAAPEQGLRDWLHTPCK